MQQSNQNWPRGTKWLDTQLWRCSARERPQITLVTEASMVCGIIFLLLYPHQLFFFFFLGGGVKMVIGWIYSRDLFETSWEGLHKVLPIIIVEESRMFTCVLSLPQWRCYRNFEPLLWHTDVHAGCWRSWHIFWSGFGWDDCHLYAHTEAKYTGITPVLFLGWDELLLFNNPALLVRQSSPESCVVL